MKRYLITIGTICLFHSCTEKTNPNEVLHDVVPDVEPLHAANITLSIGADSLIIKQLELVYLWKNKDGGSVGFDMKFIEDDQNKILAFTESRIEQTMDVTLNGVLISRATLIGPISTSLYSSMRIDFSKDDLSALNSMLIDGQVIVGVRAENKTSTIEVMEDMFE